MQSKHLIADLHFIKPDASVEPEVIYTGGETPQIYNEAYQFMPVEILNAREQTDSLNIHKHGFELTEFIPKHQDFDNADAVSDFYYQDVVQLIK